MLCGLATTAVAVNPIIVDGKDFVDSVTKDRFQIIGVEYVTLPWSGAMLTSI